MLMYVVIFFPTDLQRTSRWATLNSCMRARLPSWFCRVLTGLGACLHLSGRRSFLPPRRTIHFFSILFCSGYSAVRFAPFPNGSGVAVFSFFFFVVFVPVVKYTFLRDSLSYFLLVTLRSSFSMVRRYFLRLLGAFDRLKISCA